jgi:hypothetical protein
MASSSNHHRDMSLYGISDTELLAIVDDLSDENGWTMTIDVRLQLGENPEDKIKSGVGPRLAWMRRYGWLESGSKTWRLTAMGHAVLDHPELSQAFQSAMEKLTPAQRLQLTRRLSEDGAQRPTEVYQALRREWQRNISKR